MEQDFVLESEYLQWMYDIVFGGSYHSYRKLFKRLHEIKFRYTIPNDGNRAEDGVCLRYRFGLANGYSQHEIANLLDISDCSVLEMMLALCNRCEEKIMQNPVYGNRTGLWFLYMLDSLGLSDMTDDIFDRKKVDWIIDAFLDRNYSPCGAGGLFTLKNPAKDLRNVEIWYQAMWFFNEIIESNNDI